MVVGENGAADVRRIKETLYGPPYPGLESKVNALLTRLETQDEIREREHKANTARLNLIIAILIAIAAYIAIVVSVKQLNKGAMDPHKLFSDEPSLAVSSEP